MKYRIKEKAAQAALHAVILVLICIMLYPLAMSLWSAFKNENTFQYTKWYPTLPLFLNTLIIWATVGISIIVYLQARILKPVFLMLEQTDADGEDSL